jgi:hypothetical protein
VEATRSIPTPKGAQFEGTLPIERLDYGLQLFEPEDVIFQGPGLAGALEVGTKRGIVRRKSRERSGPTVTNEPIGR